jgi:hypothetical protein
MIIYNVTVNVDESIHNDWLNWMQNKHINDVLATGLFTNAKMVRVVVVEEMGGTTYAVQYFTDSRAKLEDYYQNHAPRLRKEGVQLFADKMLAFRTELEVISEFYGKTN